MNKNGIMNSSYSRSGSRSGRRSRYGSRMNSITVTAAAVSLIVLAGCAGIRDKSDEVIGQTTGSLEQSLIQTAEDWGQRSKEAGLSRDISTHSQVGKVTKISLDHSVGNIKITAYDGEEIRINTTVWFGKSTKLENRQHILDQAEVSVTEKENQLIIATHPKGEEGTSLWTWAEKKYGISDFMIDYAIEVPASMDIYDIHNEVGVIELYDLKGTFNISSEVGSIQMNSAHVTEKSSIQTTTGGVSVHIADMNKESLLNVKTAVGNIELTLNDAVQCTIVTKNEVGGIVGAQEGSNEINGGGGEITLQSEIGTIIVK